MFSASTCRLYAATSLSVDGLLAQPAGMALVHGLPPIDTDDDGTPDVTDNCPLIVNEGQVDTDRDGTGDACDPDHLANLQQWLGTWEVMIKGADSGLAYITFRDDLTLDGYGIQLGIVELCRYNGNWTVDATGNVLGDVRVIHGAVTNGATEFSGQIISNSTFLVNLQSAVGKPPLWKGKPADFEADLTGQWTATVQKSCPGMGEQYSIQLFQENEQSFSGLFAVDGDAERHTHH